MTIDHKYAQNNYGMPARPGRRDKSTETETISETCLIILLSSNHHRRTGIMHTYEDMIQYKM